MTFDFISMYAGFGLGMLVGGFAVHGLWSRWANAQERAKA